METIDIEKALFPKSGKLIEEDGILTAQIVDAELDELDCTFNGDGTVEIDTSRLKYINLTKENLKMLLKLIKEADRYEE